MNIKPEYEVESKWPQLIITGDTIKDRDVINEILISSDTFFTDFGHNSGINNKQFGKSYQALSGIQYVIDMQRYFERHDISIAIYDPVDAEDTYVYNNVITYVSDRLDEMTGQLDCTYLINRFATSCFVYGPHGWLSPEGKIDYIDCVGKWPSVHGIYQDFYNIANRWPFIKLTATCIDTLYIDGQDIKKPLFNITINNGRIKISDPDLSVHESKNLDENLNLPGRQFKSTAEQIGIDIPRMIEIADIIRPMIAVILKSVPDKKFNKILKKYLKEYPNPSLWNTI